MAMIKYWIGFGGYDMPKNIIIVKKYEIVLIGRGNVFFFKIRKYRHFVMIGQLAYFLFA